MTSANTDSGEPSSPAGSPAGDHAPVGSGETKDVEGQDGSDRPPRLTNRFVPPADPRQWPAWARSIDGGSLLVLRAFLGFTFCFAGMQKLANRAFFEASNSAGIQAQLKDSLSTPVGRLLSGDIHIAVLLGIVIAFSELAIGLGTLLGIFSRLAALGGFLLALSFFLTVSFNDSPYYYGPDIVFVFAWTPLLLGGAGALSLDSYFAKLKSHELSALQAAKAGEELSSAEIGGVRRRLALAQMATAGLVGGFAIFLGGLSAATGRISSKGNSTASGDGGFNGFGSGTNPPDSTSATSGASTTAGSVPVTTAGGKPAGKLLGAADKVAVGTAVGFTDPSTQQPAFCVQPTAGDFKAFSAICTHQGCTVAFNQSVNEFQCPCHGSEYSGATGAVIRGPAVNALPEIPITESGGDLYISF